MRVEDIRKVCVLGAGAMGAGIAQVCAQAGYAVAMRDIDHKFVEAGFNRIRGPLMKRVDKGKMTADEVEDIVSRIEGTVDVAVAVKGAQLVIEAVPEKMELKKAVWTEADRAAGPGTVFASNTSSLSITEMAASTRRPADFVGMHFFNPAPVMKLVEVIRGSETSKATVDFAKAFCVKVGKDPVEVREAPGFVVNRLLVPMMNEAFNLLLEGVATAEDIPELTGLLMQIGEHLAQVLRIGCYLSR